MGRSPAGLEVARTSVAGGSLVSVSGTLDEQLDRAGLVEGLGRVVLFNLDGVVRVTSFGVREWVRALKELRAESYAFVKCRPATVSQFNIVSSFGGKGALISLYAPFVCPNCNTEKEVLLDLRYDYDKIAGGREPEAKCDACGADAEFDDIPSQYFSYVLSRPRPVLPAALQQMVDERAKPRPSGVGFGLRKKVDRRVTTVSLVGEIDDQIRIKRQLEGLEGFVLIDMIEVSVATRDGLARLFKQFEKIQCFLTRVPVELYSSVCESLPQELSGRIISVVIRTPCGACHENNNAEIDCASLLDEQVGRSIAIACTWCRDVERWVVPDVLRGICARPLPPEIVAHRARIGVESMVPSAPGGADGSQVFGNYVKLRRLGVGGMAEIFLARKRGIGGFQKDVVLKQILPSLIKDDMMTAMFLQEARVAALISHPNVVQIFDLGREGETFFIVMEYVVGWDLRVVMETAQRQGIRIPIEIACRIVSDVCAGLHAAHTVQTPEGERLGIVHRDVSPRNILLSRNGNVKLTDFGVAKIARSLVETPTDTVTGKARYMAPEQAKSAESEIGPQTDVFGAAVVLFELLTGTTPFRRDTYLGTLRAVTSAAVPNIRSLRGDIPTTLENVILRGLERDRRNRYSDAQAFRVALEQVLAAATRSTTSNDVSQWLEGLMSGEQADPPGDKASPSGQTLIPSDEITAKTQVGALSERRPPVVAPLPTDGQTGEQNKDANVSPPGSSPITASLSRRAQRI